MLLNPYRFGGGGASVTPTTYDPSNKGPGISLDATELIVNPAGSLDSIKSRVSVSTGKYYWEVNVANNFLIGVGNSSQVVTGAGCPVGGSANSWAIYLWTRKPYHNAIQGAEIVASYTDDNIGLFLDADAGTLGVIFDGVEYPGVNTGMTGPYFAMVSEDGQGSGPTNITNFGATAFTWTVPTGYSSGFGAT